MLRLLKQPLNGEKGQALAIVLGLLAIGGLTIAVSLNYATTNLKGSRIIEEKMKGVYAASAGVEYALWALTHDEWLIDDDDPPLLTQLSEHISGMAVNIQAENQGTFSLYCGEIMEEAGSHVGWLSVNGEAVFDEGTISNYTITITWQGEEGQQRKLIEVGVALPAGYVYEDGSAASFDGNLSDDDPSPTGNTPGGAQWLKWQWSPGQGPEISADNATQYQKFRITGTDSLEGDYAWVVAQSGDVGTVGEISGTRYSIRANATRPGDGRTTAEIVAGIIIVGGDIQIMSWQITK